MTKIIYFGRKKPNGRNETYQMSYPHANKTFTTKENQRKQLHKLEALLKAIEAQQFNQLQ